LRLSRQSPHQLGYLSNQKVNMRLKPPVSLFHSNAAFAPSASLVAEICPARRGLRALPAAAALLMQMRAELAFLRKLSQKSKL
jgi:hypothetical protein